MSPIAFGIGVASTALGAHLLLSTPATNRPAVAIAPLVSPSSGGLSLSRTF